MTDIGKLLEMEEAKLPKLPKLPELDVVGTKDKKLMDIPEKLRLICNKCNFGASKEWMELRPAGYYVRCKKGNNFLVNRHSPHDKKLFTCPKCKNQTNIGRLPITNMNVKKRPVER